MKARWLSSALRELDRHYEYIRQENPRAARRVFTQIRSAACNLGRFPESGRVGQIDSTREVTVSGLPYLVVYRLTGGAVEILRVVHTSMNWEADTKQ